MAEFKKKIKSFSSEDLLDLTNMAKLLGHSGFYRKSCIYLKGRKKLIPNTLKYKEVYLWASTLLKSNFRN